MLTKDCKIGNGIEREHEGGDLFEALLAYLLTNHHYDLAFLIVDALTRLILRHNLATAGLGKFQDLSSSVPERRRWPVCWVCNRNHPEQCRLDHPLDRKCVFTFCGSEEFSVGLEKKWEEMQLQESFLRDLLKQPSGTDDDAKFGRTDHTKGNAIAREHHPTDKRRRTNHVGFLSALGRFANRCCNIKHVAALGQACLGIHGFWHKAIPTHVHEAHPRLRQGKIQAQ